MFKENWISEVHICLKDSISINPLREYELIKAKSDPRAEVRLRWVKVVGATYNGGLTFPPLQSWLFAIASGAILNLQKD